MKSVKLNIAAFLLVSVIGSISSGELTDPLDAEHHLRQQGYIPRALESLPINEKGTPIDINNTAGEEIETMVGGPEFLDNNITAEEELKLETTQVMDVSYFYPYYKGRRLDWCLTWANNCGRFAANAYCQMKGYHHAYDWMISHNIGKTKLIGTGQDCNSSNCDGFQYIKCSAWEIDQEKFYFSIKFNYPVYMGYPLDWCLVYEKWCGQYAANAYCRMKGYDRASGWSKWNHPGHYTHVIGDHRLCIPSSHRCDTFYYIICTK